MDSFKSFSRTSEEEFVTLLNAASKFKVRSDETHDHDHAPQLLESGPIDCLLLGNSMMERFKTTGIETELGTKATYPEFFNAGVGGDRICNVIYRLSEKGLYQSLREKGVRYAILEMGTNDLDKSALKEEHIRQYNLVLEALQRSCPGIKIAVCGLMPRLALGKPDSVEVSNHKLAQMVEEYVAQTGSSVEFMPTPSGLTHDQLEDDGVHLNEEGYQIFAKALMDQLRQMKTIEG